MMKVVTVREQVGLLSPWQRTAAADPSYLKGGKCKYCKDPATTSILHSEGMAYVQTCDKHLKKGKDAAAACVPYGGSDPSNIDKVYDLVTKKVEAATLDSINPTGGLFVDYAPQDRTGPHGPQVTTLDKVHGNDDPITIYRGAPRHQTRINPGDFVTDNEQGAQDYASGGGHILRKQVPKSHVATDPDEWEGGEHIYSPPEYRTSAYYTLDDMRHGPPPGTRPIVRHPDGTTQELTDWVHQSGADTWPGKTTRQRRDMWHSLGDWALDDADTNGLGHVPGDEYSAERTSAASPSLKDLYGHYSQWENSLSDDPDPRSSIQHWGNVESYLDDAHGLNPHPDLDAYFNHPTTIGMAKLHSMAQGKDFVDGVEGKIPNDDLLQGAALGLLKIRRQQHERRRPMARQIVAARDQVAMQEPWRLEAIRKGAPFAGYEDFDACTSENSDKRSPDAYCGEIKHRTEDKKGSRWYEADLGSAIDTLGKIPGAVSDAGKITMPEGQHTPSLGQMGTSLGDMGSAIGGGISDAWNSLTAPNVTKGKAVPEPAPASTNINASRWYVAYGDSADVPDHPRANQTYPELPMEGEPPEAPDPRHVPEGDVHNPRPTKPSAQWGADVMRHLDKNPWGVTVRDQIGDAPSSGYMVSHPGAEAEQSRSGLTPQKVREHYDKNFDLINQDPGNSYGGWDAPRTPESGRGGQPGWYHDVSQNIEDPRAAADAAVRGNQQAVYDLNKDQEVSTPDMVKRFKGGALNSLAWYA